MNLFSLQNHKLPRIIIFLLLAWQALSITLIVFGAWPNWVVWINLAAGILYIILSDSYHSILLLVASAPYFVALPSSRFETLSFWRIWFALLFMTWFLRLVVERIKIDKKLSVKNLWAGINFMPWDKFVGLFFAIALIIAPFSRFPAQSIKQLLFILNVYLLYVVLINAVKAKEQVVNVVRYSILSLGMIVLTGYIQLLSTFFTSFDTFWVFWASFISKIYYGQSLASVLLYSNSWFSYNGARELRMFSIMPDSHSFAVMAVFLISFLLALTYFYAKKGNYLLWSVVRSTGLAVILSGTRGVWAGMVAPLGVSIVMYVKRFFRPIVAKIFWSFVIIMLFFALAPLFNKAFDFLRVGGFKENFLERAQSIYDLQETSNKGRLEIWQSSLKYAVVHPLGVGFGNFVVSISGPQASGQSFSELGSVKNETYNLPQKYVTAHNLYLNILVETGILGLIAFLWFWFKYYLEVWKFIWKYKDQDNFSMFFVIVTSLTFLWLLAYGMFDVTLFNDKVLMYTLVSLGLSGIIMKNYNTYQ